VMSWRSLNALRREPGRLRTLTESGDAITHRTRGSDLPSSAVRFLFCESMFGDGRSLIGRRAVVGLCTGVGAST